MIILLAIIILVVIIYFIAKPSEKKFDSILKSIFTDIQNNFDINKLNPVYKSVQYENGTFDEIIGFTYKTSKGLLAIEDRSFRINDDLLYYLDLLYYTSSKRNEDVDIELHRKIFKYLENKYDHKDDAIKAKNKKLWEEDEKERIKNLKNKYSK